MSRFWPSTLALVTGSVLVSAATMALAEGPTETILFVRHGEKPEAGLGQLDCQGLNRAIALSAVLAGMAKAKNWPWPPAAVLAPNPSREKDDSGASYAYVRPLATIEPTAISLALPVDVSVGYDDLPGLEKLLDSDRFRSSTVLVAWEHKEVEQAAGDLVAAHGGDRNVVPKWHGKDFDSVYVVKIVRGPGVPSATFETSKEGLDGQPMDCPSAKTGAN